MRARSGLQAMSVEKLMSVEQNDECRNVYDNQLGCCCVLLLRRMVQGAATSTQGHPLVWVVPDHNGYGFIFAGKDCHLPPRLWDLQLAETVICRRGRLLHLGKMQISTTKQIQQPSRSNAMVQGAGCCCWLFRSYSLGSVQRKLSMMMMLANLTVLYLG